MKLAGRLRVLSLIAVVTLSACAVGEDSRLAQPEYIFQPRDPLTVMTFNIRVGYGRSSWGTDPYLLRDGPEELGPIVAAIRSVDPDIVGLQEVLHNGQADRIAKALGYNYAYTSHPSDRPWWGVAVLARYPLIEAREHQISSGRGDAKNALIAEFDIGGNRIAFFSIHKDKDLHDGASFQKLRSAIDDSDVPTVLIGDFNIEPHDGRFELLGSEFLDTALAVDSFGAKEARTMGTWGDGLGYRTVSWHISIPRSNRRSSTRLSDSG